ncbi:sigma-70 family RNA polymerase sigma factor [Nonlabens sp. Ci31]|jgi:RNA polymerase sigma-70 factor (ECF subfamily)|uniref:RNA polymerase sigma factor n=1 Tax=Nonlabens sp. Ci31 TaxID=2608253 RepID=UPI0014636346|nr:sigma-70 family RNA polymerase sigma factor [Nonlabens sp. Ci31]QJP35003.1 sigma-70 family RNA polymerase sigma factor [Nonlabens sp. Ci31]
MNLEKIIKQCKKGDIKAQKELYDTYKDGLFVLCLKYSRNREEAEDNLQDSFMVIFTSIEKYKGKGSFEGWMKRIVINKAITLFKRESNFNVLINEDITKDIVIEKSLISAIPLQEILRAVQELPTRYKMVFNLYEMDNYTHKEVAQMLDITEGTSKSNLYRAKVILKESLQKWNTTSKNRSYGN